MPALRRRGRGSWPRRRGIRGPSAGGGYHLVSVEAEHAAAPRRCRGLVRRRCFRASGGVLYHWYAVAVGDLGYAVDPVWHAVERHGYYGFGLRPVTATRSLMAFSRRSGSMFHESPRSRRILAYSRYVTGWPQAQNVKDCTSTSSPADAACMIKA